MGRLVPELPAAEGRNERPKRLLGESKGVVCVCRPDLTRGIRRGVEKRLLKTNRILCPIVFSDSSAKAYDYAESFAWHHKASLWLVHITETLSPYPFNTIPETYLEVWRQLRADAEQQLQESARTHTRLGVRPECCGDGIVADEIVDLAESRSVSVIVMGTHGAQGTDRGLLGSVTDEVLRKPVSADHRACFGVSNRLGRPGCARAERLGCRGVWFDDLPGGSVRPVPGPGGIHPRE